MRRPRLPFETVTKEVSSGWEAFVGDKSTRQGVLFQKNFSKAVVARFDAEGQSSDGGAVLLKGVDDAIVLIESLGQHLVDDRDARRAVHSYVDLFRQRVYGIALGYSDCNDAQKIGGDPCVKLACDRSPLDRDDDLGSQPTLSRFENSQRARSVLKMLRELEAGVIKRLAKRHRKARLVTIDVDPSCDPTHGQQQQALFHGKYGTWCYLPQFAFLSFDDQPEQHLFYARLRPGNSRCHRGAIPLLRRVVPELRKSFPRAKIRVRLDCGFQAPRLLDVLDELRVQYVVGSPKNSVLLKFAESPMRKARAETKKSGETATMFSEAAYKAGSWKRPRRAVIKAEVVRLLDREPRDNPRFVITNLRHSPKNVYRIYRKRGDSENRIKEMQELDSDRTSCTRFVANQLRLLMTATAYVLYQELRWRLRHTRAATSQVGQLRLMLMKVATRLIESVRRFVLHFPIGHPWQDVWVRAAQSVGAR